MPRALHLLLKLALLLLLLLLLWLLLLLVLLLLLPLLLLLMLLVLSISVRPQCCRLDACMHCLLLRLLLGQLMRLRLYLSLHLGRLLRRGQSAAWAIKGVRIGRRPRC